MSSLAAGIWHRDDCDGTGPIVERLMNAPREPGEVIARCVQCGRYAIGTPESDLEPLPSTGFVCPDHGHPVTWRGKGCPECRVASRRRTRREVGRIENDA